MQAHDATRVLAVVGGMFGLGLFYQPWVEGKVPGLATPVALSGLDLAAGRARELADAASAPMARTASQLVAAPAGAAPAGGSALTLPTRRPTIAPGAQAPGGLSMPAQATPTPAAAAAGAGGMALPTRRPTFAPDAQAPGSLSAPGQATPTAGPTMAPGAATATRAPVAATGGAPASGLAAAAQAQTGTQRAVPAQLPKLTLYAVPLAGAGVVAFTATFGLLRDPRDRRFARWWTVLCGLIGTWGAGTVASAVVGATSPNDLLAPGQATAVLWGAWGSIVAFGVAAISLAWTWITMARANRST